MSCLATFMAWMGNIRCGLLGLNTWSASGDTSLGDKAYLEEVGQWGGGEPLGCQSDATPAGASLIPD